MERLTIRYNGEKVPFCPPCIKCATRCDECEHLDKMMYKLADYEDAEEQGLLLRLPCAIGTTVYAVVRECEGDSFECYHTCDTCTWSDTHIKEVIFDIEYIGDVGNWIFLTKEEAEQALANMQKA